MAGIIALAILALVFATFEIFIPGGILAGLAFLSLLAASMLAFQNYGLAEAVLTFSFSLVIIVLAVVLELRIIQKTRLRERFVLSGSIQGRTLEPKKEEDSLVGQTGETVTPLSPTGLVRIGEKTYESASKSGRLSLGESVRVIGRDNFRILVVRRED